MGFLTALPIIGKVLEGVFGIVDKAVLDKDEAAKLKATIQMQMLNQDHTEVTALLKSQASIIMSETQGQSWLQRNWRPLLMLIFMIIIANNYILFPYLSLFTEQTVMLELPDFMWKILQIGIGGYIAGRSGEKIMKTWKENKGE
jgi:hypothetical protein